MKAGRKIQKTFNKLGPISRITNGTLYAGGAAMVLSLCAGGMARADDGVTVYGLIDDSIASTHTGGTRTRPGNNQVSLLTGGWTDSLWGIKGEESLDGGWKARFGLESGIDSATGRSLDGQDRLFDYGAWVGLDHAGYGAVKLGRLSTVAQEYGGQLEVASWRDMGMGQLLKDSDNFRRDRTLNLYTPDIGGAQLGVGRSFNDRSGVPDMQAWSLGFKYASGPWLGVLTWDRSSRALGDSHGGSPSAAQAGVTYITDDGYQFSVAWSRQRNGFVEQDIGWSGGPAAFMYGGYADSWLVGAQIPVSTSGSVLMQVSQDRPSWHEADGSRAHPVALATLGYRYTLSPRTSLYAFIGRQTRGSLADPFDHDTGGVTRVAVGVTHSF
ncbi:MAG TPA: porin [Bordetella sp.]